MKPRFTLVICYRLLRQVVSIHQFISASSRKVRKAAIGQLFISVTSATKITMKVWIS